MFCLLPGGSLQEVQDRLELAGTEIALDSVSSSESPVGAHRSLMYTRPTPRGLHAGANRKKSGRGSAW